MDSNTMRAVQYEKYGGGADGLKHVEMPIPVPKKDEILIKTEAASINPVDWKMQKGALRPFMPPKFPFIPLMDIAGEVLQLGPGVTSFNIGDKVLGLLNFSTCGGLAEYAVAPTSFIAKRPPNLSPVEAAGLPGAGLTALQSLKSCGIKFDAINQKNPQNVLITAASGGVGHFAVQLAKIAGLHVTATCGARNVNFVKDLGADEILDYKTSEGAMLKSPSGLKYDSVVHCAPHVNWNVFDPNLSENAKVIDLTPNMKSIFTSVLKKVTFAKKKLLPLFLVPKEGELEFLVDLVKDGKLKCVVDSTFPLSQAQEAWAKSMEGHATGKIVVEM